MSKPTEVRVVPHGTPEYLQEVELRRRMLRLPLGLDFCEEELAAESVEGHIVAIDGKTVVGCLVMVPLGGGVVKMRQVAVEPHLQGQGIGAKLVAASEVWAVESGFERIELSARDSAVEFYLRLGYRIVGEPFVEVTIPHRKMIKELRR